MKRLLKYFRIVSFDKTSEQGRANERYRIAAWSVLFSAVSRGLSFLVMILTVSLTLSYLGVERFGMWVTVSSFAGMLVFLDMGIGNALSNKITEVSARGSPALLRNSISGGLFTLFILSVAIGLILVSLFAMLPWEKLIKFSSNTLAHEFHQTVLLFALLFAVYLFSNGVLRVFAGLQRAYEAHFFSACCSLICLLGLWIATHKHAGIPILLLVTLGFQCLPGLALLYLLRMRKLLSTIDLRKNTLEASSYLFRTGGLFLILQLGAVAAWGADSLIISSSLGVTQVAICNIAQRLCQLVSQPLSLVNAPFWAAYADAQARRESGFIQKTLKRSILLNAGVGLSIACLLLPVSQSILQYWTSGKVQIPLSIIAIYMFWAVIESISGAFAMFMNGCNIVLPQVYGVISLVVISIPIKIYLISNHGLEAMLIGFILLYLCNIFFWYGIVYRRTITRLLT